MKWCFNFDHTSVWGRNIGLFVNIFIIFMCIATLLCSTASNLSGRNASKAFDSLKIIGSWQEMCPFLGVLLLP